MKKFRFRNFALRMAGIFLMMTILLLFTSCGKSTEEQLVGSWYKDGKTSIMRDGTRGPIFILYDDGTCELASEYGAGKWSIINKNQLKLTNFYGESNTATIVNIESGELTLESDGVEVTYLNEPQND